jgi:hypothetical protein
MSYIFSGYFTWGANEAGVFLAQSDYCRMNEDLALSVFDFDSDKEM